VSSSEDHFIYLLLKPESERYDRAKFSCMMYLSVTIVVEKERRSLKYYEFIGWS